MSVPVTLAFLFSVQIAFIQHFIFGYQFNLLLDVTSALIYHIVLTILSNILFILIGLKNNSKYSIISSVRSVVHVISLDIFITIIYSWFVFSAQSTNFHDFILFQKSVWSIFLSIPLSFIFITVLFLESKRAPFDHSETESEVVAGYATESNASMLLIFFLCEYAHLAISAFLFIILFLGGWNLINLKIYYNICIVNYYDYILWNCL